jgi:hypothetical protein
VEKHEGEGDLGSLACQPIGVAFAVPLDQAVRLHFAQIIAELVQAVARGGELEGDQEGVVDLLGRPFRVPKKGGSSGAQQVLQNVRVVSSMARLSQTGGEAK